MKKSKKIIFILTLMGMLFSSTTAFADGWKTWNSNDFKKAWEAYAHGVYANAGNWAKVEVRHAGSNILYGINWYYTK